VFYIIYMYYKIGINTIGENQSFSYLDMNSVDSESIAVLLLVI
jgi:hypothetical protein